MSAGRPTRRTGIWDGVPVVVGHLVEQVVADDADVVDQHGRRAQLAGHPADRGLDLLGVGHVRAHRQRLTPAAATLSTVDL